MPLPARNNLALIDFHWAFNPWLVLLFALAAGALVVYLYRAQQRIASRRIILLLTALRVALMLLVLVLLAGPVYQWRRSADAGGTLFVVLDQSPSMAHVDRQATPVERLRWADALGLIPSNLRPAKMDRQVAVLSALRQEWDALKARGELAVEDKDAVQRVGRFTDEVGRWAGRLNVAADALGRDPIANGKGAPVVQSLREAVDLARKATHRAGTRPRPADAAADVPWQAVAQRLDSALANLPPVADEADAAFLADHGNDPPVRAAMGDVAGMTRSQFLIASLTAKAKGSDTALADVLPRQNVRVVAFADAPQPLAVDDPKSLPDLLKKSLAPAGSATNLAAALSWVQQQIGPDQPASVLVISDGRQNLGGDLIEPARLLAARDARVFTLAVGSAEVVPDAAVEQIDAPEWVYQGDVVRGDAMVRLDGLSDKPVNVEVRRRGGPGGPTSEEKVIETKTVTAGQKQDAKRVGFRDQPGEPGLYEYEVKVADVEGEAVTENNRQSVRVSVRKDKLNVLLVEEQPRWEYRYLANYLERDGRVKLQSVLLEPAQVEQVVRPAPVRASPENKQTLVDQLPNTKEGWAAFDLIVLGDVPPEALNEQNQQWIASAVQDRGAALVLIAGPFNLPQRYARAGGGNVAATSLTIADARSLIDLFPVYRDAAWSPDGLAAHLKQGFAPQPAPEGLGSVLSQFTVDERYNARLWSSVPAWYWHSPFTRAKPGASVLWGIGEAKERSADAAKDASTPQDRALLATMQFGAGRVMYLASDQTWRLRQVNGQNLHERFWGQVIRWAAGNDLPAGGKFLRFGTDEPRYVGGEPVRVTARLLDREKLVPLSGQKELKVVARAGGKVVGEAPLVEAPDAPGLYRAELSGLPAGTIDLAPEGGPVASLLANDPSVTLKSLAVDVQTQAKLEQRNLNTDRGALARVARAGGGIALDAAYADVLAGSIPELNYRTETLEQFGLFADPKDAGVRKAHWLFLALFTTLITAEWVIRKAGGLV